MLNIDPTNLDDMYLWFDLISNVRHLKYDGKHYICDNSLFNRCKEQSLEIRELRADNERLQRKLKQHYEEAYREGYDDASEHWQKAYLEICESMQNLLDKEDGK